MGSSSLPTSELGFLPKPWAPRGLGRMLGSPAPGEALECTLADPPIGNKGNASVRAAQLRQSLAWFSVLHNLTK